MNKNICFLILALTLSMQVFSADFRHYNDDECSGALILSGTIKKGDVSIFQKGINYYRKRFNEGACNRNLLPKDFKFFLTIYLNSDGGDVEESMNIGHIIRENEFFTSVSFKDKCLSSCVFILASGVRRDTLVGKVGIHKPYFTDLNEKQTILEIKKIREENIRKMKEYFKFMDISEFIVDSMLSIEPNKIKILKENELEYFRLSLPDANYEEKTTAKDAHKYNLTSAEFRKREVIVESKCGSFPRNSNNFLSFIQCKDMVFLDISAEEYERRRAKTIEKCRHLKNDEEKINSCVYDFSVLGK